MKRIICFSISIILLFSLLILTAGASKPLDEIQEYKITVDVRKDGTMDIKYHIVWKVLDSTSEGPLEWVKIGIPNKNVDEIKALSDNISKIKYYNDGGEYVRIDFNNSYKANEIVTFDYSIHQSYMYTIDKSAALIKYSFTPGWFEETKVDSIKILWNKNNVNSSDSTATEGDYLVWNGSLNAGGSKTVSVTYKTSSLNVDSNKQYYGSSNYYKSNSSGSIASAIIPLLIVVFGIFIAIKTGRSRYRGGFGGSHFIGGGFGGGHCACASSCACACACACAGGGRAGCSAKNFYGTSVDAEKLKKAIKNKK